MLASEAVSGEHLQEHMLVRFKSEINDLHELGSIEPFHLPKRKGAVEALDKH